MVLYDGTHVNLIFFFKLTFSKGDASQPSLRRLPTSFFDGPQAFMSGGGGVTSQPMTLEASLGMYDHDREEPIVASAVGEGANDEGVNPVKYMFYMMVMVKMVMKMKDTKQGRKITAWRTSCPSRDQPEAPAIPLGAGRRPTIPKARP